MPDKPLLINMCSVTQGWNSDFCTSGCLLQQSHLTQVHQRQCTTFTVVKSFSEVRPQCTWLCRFNRCCFLLPSPWLPTPVLPSFLGRFAFLEDQSHEWEHHRFMLPLVLCLPCISSHIYVLLYFTTPRNVHVYVVITFLKYFCKSLSHAMGFWMLLNTWDVTTREIPPSTICGLSRLTRDLLVSRQQFLKKYFLNNP